MKMMSEAIDQLATALSKAQGEMMPAAKDSANPFFKSKYADLSSIREASRIPLRDNGLSISQTTQFKDGMLFMVTTLLHISGQWISSELPLDPAKKDPQTMGSLMTYYRRYGLQAILNIASEDDDGEKAQSPYRRHQERLNDSIEANKSVKDWQIKELDTALNMCTTEYRNWVMDSLKKNYNVDNLRDLPLDIYERIKSAALKNRVHYATNEDIAIAEKVL